MSKMATWAFDKILTLPTSYNDQIMSALLHSQVRDPFFQKEMGRKASLKFQLKFTKGLKNGLILFHLRLSIYFRTVIMPSRR